MYKIIHDVELPLCPTCVYCNVFCMFRALTSHEEQKIYVFHTFS